MNDIKLSELIKEKKEFELEILEYLNLKIEEFCKKTGVDVSYIYIDYDTDDRKIKFVKKVDLELILELKEVNDMACKSKPKKEKKKPKK